MEELLAEAVTPGGTRPLSFQRMLDVLEAGHAAGLALFSVDVTTCGGGALPEWMFRLTDQEVQSVAVEQVIPMALDFYRQNGSNPELTSGRFEVFFDKAR